MMLRLDRSSELKDAAIPWQLTPDHSAKLPTHDFVPPNPSSNPVPTVVAHPILPDADPVDPNLPPSDPAAPAVNIDPPAQEPSSGQSDASKDAAQSVDTPKLFNTADHLTPLTDVPSDDEDEKERAQERTAEGDVDEGYQSGGPSAENASIEKENSSPAASVKPVTANVQVSTPRKDATNGVPPGSSPSSSPPRPHINGDGSQSAVSTPTKSQPTEIDPKIVLLLELNAELLKIFAGFQSRGLHTNPEGAAYSSRLASNLNWLANTVDKRSDTVPLPSMDCPPVAGLVDGARLKQLYEKLPGAFAKDIARRQQQHVALKRERTPDDVGNIASKRRDLGDSKLSSMSPHAPPSLDHPVNLNGAGLVNQVVPNHTLSGLPAPALSNTQVSVTPMQPGLPNPQMAQVPRIAQSAPNAEYLRQIQMRNAAQRQGAHGSPPPPQLRHNSSGAPDPAATMPSQPQPFPAMGQPHTGMPPPPNPNPVLEILQNPSHPIMKFILSRDPTFTQRPMQSQVAAIRTVQARQMQHQQQLQAQAQAQAQQQSLVQQQQQQQQQMLSQAGQPQMGRLPGQPGGGSLVPTQTNAMMGGNQFRPGTSGGQHAASKQQPLHPSMGAVGGMPADGSMGGNPMMMPIQTPTSNQRPGSSGHFQMGGPNMASQQRQLMLMQQQQMRNVSGGQVGSPQSFAAQQSPAFHQSPTHVQTPSFMEGVDPARPGSAVQAIAGSTRSPSEPLGTPTKRQMSFSGEYRPQNMMNPGTQPPQQPQQPNMQGAPIMQQQQQHFAQQQQQQQQPQGVPQGGPQGWPTNFSNPGMSPAAFQLSQPPGNLPQFINPAALGGSPMPSHQPVGPPMGGPQWAGNPQFSHAGSPAPSMQHSDPGHVSRHTSATPAPMSADPSQTTFDQSMYTWN